MGLRSPVQCSPADAAAQSFLRSPGQFRDAAGKAKRRAGGAEVTWRLHWIGGRLVPRPYELRSSLIFKPKRCGQAESPPFALREPAPLLTIQALVILTVGSRSIRFL